MNQSAPYPCMFLDRDGLPISPVDLVASSDAYAVILGNTVNQERPGYNGFEIRRATA